MSEASAPSPAPDAADSSLADEGEDSPGPWALEAQPRSPAPLERILRGLWLPPLLVACFSVLLEVFGLAADLVWYLFVAQLGLLAVPLAYAEAALVGRSKALQTAAGVCLLLLTTGAAWLLLGQTFYAQSVLEGSDQGSAFRASVRVLDNVSLSDTATYLFPLSFPFTAALLFDLQGIRWRWQPLLLSLCVPAAAGLMGTLRDLAPAKELDLTIVFSAALMIPLAKFAAAKTAEAWNP